MTTSVQLRGSKVNSFSARSAINTGASRPDNMLVSSATGYAASGSIRAFGTHSLCRTKGT